jgi:hypothetical protein
VFLCDPTPITGKDGQTQTEEPVLFKKLKVTKDGDHGKPFLSQTDKREKGPSLQNMPTYPPG